MSAQQHRERQRQHVKALEDRLKGREDEIAKLEEQVRTGGGEVGGGSHTVQVHSGQGA